MKKLIIAALLVVGITAFAQNRKEMENRPDRSKMEKFSPEQRTQLMVKKLTLELDLNAKQQEQMKQIIAEQGVCHLLKKLDTFLNPKQKWKQ